MSLLLGMDVAVGGVGGGVVIPVVGVPAVWSDLVADVPGVNVHTAFSNATSPFIYQSPGPYATAVAAMEAALTYTGIRHVRDLLSLNHGGQRAAINAFFSDLGVDCLMTAGTLWNAATPPTASAIATDIATHYPTAVVAVEGLNESDGSNSGIPADWVAQTTAYQTTLASAVRGIGRLVVSPPMASTGHMVTLGNQDAASDVCGMHVYDGAHQPGTSSSNNSYSNAVTTSAVNVNPSKPRWLTECGDHDAIHTANGFPPVTEAVAGVYAPLVVLEAWLAGVKRAYRYELGDAQADSAYVKIQPHFGMFAWNNVIGTGQSTPQWRPKPSATAIRNMQALIADPGTPYTPANLDITLTGDVNLRSVVMGKRDGTYVVACWRNVPIWTPSTTANAGVAVTVAAETITATFGTSRTVDWFQPSTSSSSLQTGTGVTSFTFPVAGEAVFLKIV